MLVHEGLIKGSELKEDPGWLRKIVSLESTNGSDVVCKPNYQVFKKLSENALQIALYIVCRKEIKKMWLPEFLSCQLDVRVLEDHFRATHHQSPYM